MKILVISTPIFVCPPPGYSGLEMLAWQKAEGLAKKGHDVTLIAPQGSRCDHAKLLCPTPPMQGSEESWYGMYWQELPKFDVIIDESWNKWSLNLKAEGRLHAPSLCVCHAPVNTMFGSMPPVERPCFVCISEDQGSHFRALFSRDCRVAYNGVDMDFYKPLGIPRSGRFLFLARFSRIKGAGLALDACQAAGVGLDLIGDTSITNEPDYLAECQAKCDGRRLRAIGPATRGNCVWWFSQAHTLLHPNFPAPYLGHPGFREPFGLSPVEAMACGCPVIAGDYGAMRETVDPGGSGWLVDSLDGLVKTIKEWGPEMGISDTLRKYCREWAGQFSLPRMIDRYEQLCQEAIESGGW